MVAVGDQEVFLFDLHYLTRLSKWAEIGGALGKSNMIARPLKLADFENGYDQLLAQLTTVESTTKAEFEERFREMRTVNMFEDHYAIVVLEDTITKKVVASATLSLELKFIHRCSVRGRMDDLAILDSNGDKKECGRILIMLMIELAREIYNCYKLTVNCGHDQRGLYLDNGFTYGSNVLCVKFEVGGETETKISTAIDSSAKNDVHLFNQHRLTQQSKWADIDEALAKSDLLARPLKLSDYENGYLELLEQLTVVGSITKGEFEERFFKMSLLNQAKDDLYMIVIIEDKITGKVVGATTLFLELKFSDHCSVRGRLEDVAVLNTYRGKKIGEIVVKIIVQLAKEMLQCSMITLDCEDDLKKFYARNNFIDHCDMLKIKFYD